MAWYDKAIDKQLNLIKQIENTCGVVFSGSNRQEASIFIAKWLPKKQFLDNLERALSISVFSASKTHGQWEEHYNNRNELNVEKLKGHMLRGDATPLDAFTEYIVGNNAGDF